MINLLACEALPLNKQFRQLKCKELLEIVELQRCYAAREVVIDVSGQSIG